MKKICFWLCCFSMFSLIQANARNIPDISGIFDDLDKKIDNIGGNIKKQNNISIQSDEAKQNNSLEQIVTDAIKANEQNDSLSEEKEKAENFIDFKFGSKPIKYQNDFWQKDVWHSVKETIEYSFVKTSEGREELQTVQYIGRSNYVYSKISNFYLAVGRVNAPSGINLRKQPGTSASKTGGLINNEVVIIINTCGPKGTFDNINDYWYYVKGKNTEGWCFGGFVDTIGCAEYFFELPENSYENYPGMIIPCFCNLESDLEKEAVKAFIDSHSNSNGKGNALEGCYHIDYRHEREKVEIMPEFRCAYLSEMDLDYDPIDCTNGDRLYWAIVKVNVLNKYSVRICLVDSDNLYDNKRKYGFTEFVLRKINGVWYIDCSDDNSFKTHLNAVVINSNSNIYEKPDSSSKILKYSKIGEVLQENAYGDNRSGCLSSIK